MRSIRSIVIIVALVALVALNGIASAQQQPSNAGCSTANAIATLLAGGGTAP